MAWNWYSLTERNGSKKEEEKAFVSLLSSHGNRARYAILLLCTPPPERHDRGPIRLVNTYYYFYYCPLDSKSSYARKIIQCLNYRAALTDEKSFYLFVAIGTIHMRGTCMQQQHLGELLVTSSSGTETVLKRREVLPNLVARWCGDIFLHLKI